MIPIRRIVSPAALVLLSLGLAAPASAQFGGVIIDPSRGPRPTLGPGGYITGGFGYGAYGPGGYGSYPGLYIPPYSNSNGPSPYYSPIFNALAAMPPADAPYAGPGGERAGWALRPSLPLTGRSILPPRRNRRADGR